MMPYDVNTGSGDTLLPNGTTKPLVEPMFTYH